LLGDGVLMSFLTSARNGHTGAAQTRSYDFEPRGTIGRLERLPSLDVESRDDFLTGFRSWKSNQLQPASRKRFNDLLLARDLDPNADLSLDLILEIVGNDHLIGTEARARSAVHDLMHANFDNEFRAKADMYLAELEASDAAGPGTLELNPSMHIPDYTRHEIHTQPGGYVGHPFAGHIYHYSTNNFYMGLNSTNYQDELHTHLGSQIPKPEDGRVNRLLDMGCGIGQLAVALKERFSDAKVWGIDIGAPMLRYGHLRANELNVDVNFAQRLAEDTKFPDNHFDVVTSYILHHEVTEQASKQIINETFRILRPGGVFFPLDFYTGASRAVTGAYNRYSQWKDHRWNHEIWRLEYAAMDFPGEMRNSGFEVSEKGPPAWRSRHNLIGIKPA